MAQGGYYQGLLGAQGALADIEQKRRRTGLLDLQSQAAGAELEEFQKTAPLRTGMKEAQLKAQQALAPQRAAELEGQGIQNRAGMLKMIQAGKSLFPQVGDQMGLDQANQQFEQFTGQPSPYRGKQFTPDFRDRVIGDLMTIEQRVELSGKTKTTAPAGYRPTAQGNLEAIPGGPADVKAGAEALKTEKHAQLASSRGAIVAGKVDDALKKIGAFGLLTTGLTGKIWGYAPGTSAYDLEKDLDTIRAQVGFQELQAMRESSPTGGALGQIAVRELEFLQAAIANLDRGQSREQLVKNLGQVKQHFENWKNVMRQAGGQGGAEQSYGRRGGDKLKLNPQTGRLEYQL